MTYDQALSYLYSFLDLEKRPAEAFAPGRFDLRRVEALLARAGDPHLGRVTVHIAGTKGKGSTAAMTASILQAAGYRTGLLTSPHLVDFRERVRVDGRLIPEAAFAALVERLRPEVEAYHRHPEFGVLTTFELTTVLAFMHFRREGATAQVLEVGMGGRLDATSVVPRPDVCVITPISYDHTEVLGHTLEAIAGEKAGIVKAGRPVVMAPQEPEARAVIARRCYELGAPLVDVERRARWKRTEGTLEGQRFEMHGLKTGFALSIPLLGAFQVENAAVAVVAAEVLREQGVPVTRTAIEQGLARVRWPGRLQVMARAPLLVVDGAHNVASARRLAEALSADLPHRDLYLVAGIFADKDMDAMARELAPAARLVIATGSAHPRAAPAESVARAFARAGTEVETVEGVAAGLDRARSLAAPDDLICATGSFQVVGEVLKLYPAAREDLLEGRLETGDVA